MYRIADLLVIRAFSPVHAGCGSDLGVVDLPIQREKHTGYPKVESTGLKGSVRQGFEEQAQSERDVFVIHNLFGYDAGSRNSYFESGVEKNVNGNVKKTFGDKAQLAGAIGFTDARILMFPVISAQGVFSYVTSYQVLKRFFEEAGFSDIVFDCVEQLDIPGTSSEGDSEAVCSQENTHHLDGVFVLSDYTFKRRVSESFDKMLISLAEITGIAEKELKDRLLLIPEEEFKDFVTMATEVITRIKIDDRTGIVVPGALFTEEYLPEESVLYASVFYSPIYVPVRMEEQMAGHEASEDMGEDGRMGLTERESRPVNAEQVKEEFRRLADRTPMIQLGSGASIGKGLVQMRLYHGKGEAET